MNEPTKKQLMFIEEICDILDLPKPNPKTKFEASQFISENIEDYRLCMDGVPVDIDS